MRKRWASVPCVIVIALGGRVWTKKEIMIMTHTRFAFVKAQWHADIVDRAYDGFTQEIPASQVEVFDVPGAFEMPLMARDLAGTGQYDAVICAAFVVDGGIYRHDFVAQSVVDGLMRVGLDTGVPVLSVSLTPHHYQETDHHNAIYRAHFVTKGKEAASAALGILKARASLRAKAA
ncbi:6,7-dimethyl-8-ribityllumazine synthase [Roseobacter sp. EG26]|uniref:6,7-dimethyl-8-ribityllumazine synthase n=1 Tax=Roseobacter sp. EG26 TaxID=3412477 RepID=UPI003CE4EC46